MKEEKRIITIKNSSGENMEAELITYLISEDNRTSYMVYSKGEKVILGIGTTFQNILDGNIINTVHKVEGKVEEIEELIIKGNEYLADIQINLDQVIFILYF